jgi:hypothetical protein
VNSISWWQSKAGHKSVFEEELPYDGSRNGGVYSHRKDPRS